MLGHMYHIQWFVIWWICSTIESNLYIKLYENLWYKYLLFSFRASLIHQQCEKMRKEQMTVNGENFLLSFVT